MSDSITQVWSESDEQAVRAELDRILSSSAFQQSRRRQRFLEFLVNETLAGRGERLKGYTIGLEVLGRPATFDPLIDPVVRIEAGRLREKLRAYYATDGAHDPVRIDLPKGSYTLAIEVRQPAANGLAPDSAVGQSISATFVDSKETRPPAARRWPELRPRWSIAAAALMIFAMLGASLWQHRPALGPQRTVEQWERDAARKGPVLAVLPFSNLSGDPKQEYFSDGLTEDIRTELSRARDLSVLAGNLTFAFKGQAVDVKKLGRELNADYVLEGGIQRSGNRLRVTAQLIDTGSGRHVWADRFDREMSDVLLVQDELVSEIVSKLTGGFGVIELAESRSSKRKSPDEVEAYDLVLRAQDVMRPEWSRRTFSAAKELLTHAISSDPANARAHRELAYLSSLGWVFRFDAVPASPKEIIVQATRSVQLDPTDARAHMVAAAAYFWTNQLDLFEHEAEEALALAPYDAEILATIGSMKAKSGEWERGVPMVEKANALNSYAAAGWYQSTRALDAYVKGDHERALAFLRQSTDQGTFYIYLEYIPVYGQLGRKEDALVAWRKLLEEEPGASLETFKSWFRLWNTREEDLARFLDGIERSGVLSAGADPRP